MPAHTKIVSRPVIHPDNRPRAAKKLSVAATVSVKAPLAAQPIVAMGGGNIARAARRMRRVKAGR